MPKHGMYSREVKKDDNKKRTHPIWRGIGFVLITVIPLISYAASTILVDNRSKLKWLVIPEDVVNESFSDPYIFVRLIYAVIITFLLFFVSAIVTFSLNKYLGPPRFGPFDVKH